VLAGEPIYIVVVEEHDPSSDTRVKVRVCAATQDRELAVQLVKQGFREAFERVFGQRAGYPEQLELAGEEEASGRSGGVEWVVGSDLCVHLDTALPGEERRVRAWITAEDILTG
jgi:hypothetical protein